MTVAELSREVGGSALDVRASLDRLGARVSHHIRGADCWSISIEEMLAPPGVRAIYEALGSSFHDTMKVQRALLENTHDGWRGNLIKERVVMRALYEVLADEDTTRRIFTIAKEETDF